MMRKNIIGTNDLRHRNQENQEESGNDNATTGSERKNEIGVEVLDASATGMTAPTFVDRIKNAFKNIKDRIKKIIKGEEETLGLEAPQVENKDKENEVGGGESPNDPWRKAETPTITITEFGRTRNTGDRTTGDGVGVKQDEIEQ